MAQAHGVLVCVCVRVLVCLCARVFLGPKYADECGAEFFECRICRFSLARVRIGQLMWALVCLRMWLLGPVGPIMMMMSMMNDDDEDEKFFFA